MSKKILSLALVVVMVMSMFAISTNAVELTTGQIGLVVTSDATVGQKAGTYVTVSFAYDVPDGEDIQLTAHNISLAYNSAVFAPDKTTFAYSDEYVNYFKFNATTTCNIADTISKNIVKKFNEADTARGWDKAMQIAQGYDTSTEYTSKTGYPCHDEVVVWSVQFEVLKDLTADDVIGIPSGAVANGTFVNPKQFTTTTTAGIAYSADNIDTSRLVSVPAAAAAEPTVTVVGAQSKWANGIAGKDYLFGYVGALANYDVQTNDEDVVTAGAKNVTNITSITATAKINGTTVTSLVHTIWKDGDVYKFRASFDGFDYNTAIAVEAMSFTVVTDDGTFTSTNYAGTDTVNSIYLASVANGLTAA